MNLAGPEGVNTLQRMHMHMLAYYLSDKTARVQGNQTETRYH